MKKLTSSLIAAGVIAGASMSAPVMAEGPSANVTYVSDYVWRGVTQTNSTATIQGGLDWEKDKLSFGTWASGLNSGGTEFDLYGSYNFGPVSVGAIAYIIALDKNYSTSYEVNVGGDLGPVSLLASYDPDASSYYVEAGYSMEVSKGVSLDLHAGYDDDDGSGSSALDYSLGVSGSAGGLDLGLAYAYGEADTGNEGKIFVSVGKSM